MSDKSNDKKKLSKRKIIKGIAASSVLGTAGVGSAQAESQKDSEVEIKRTVTELKKGKGKYVGDAQSDEEVKKLDEELKSDDWKPDEGGATVIRVEGANKDSDLPHERYHVVILPYTRSGSSNDTRLLWTDKSLESVGLESPLVHEIQAQESKNIQSSSESTSQTDGKNKREVTTYLIKDDEVVTESQTVDTNPGNTKSGTITPLSSCYCETTIYECEGLGLWCYISLAGSYAGTYWACGTCASGVGWVTCGKCAVAVITSGAGTIDCFENQDCYYKDLCRSEDELNNKACKVCDNIYYPTC